MRIDFFGDEKFEILTEIDQPQIRKNDYFLVRTGDQVPADGTIVWGTGWVDESMISGESVPVEKNTGSLLVAGTILKDGTLKMKATAVGSETTLSRIIEMVNDAQRNKPTIQKLADKITATFVPVVLAISAVTLLAGYFVFDLSFQQALMNSIGVLVISCPCAMGLATPTAVMVGIGRAAKKGILVKGAQSLETLASVKTVVFDKTGTLTTGRFQITGIKALSVSEEELKTILYSVERYSSHPLAKSIVSGLQTTDFFELKTVAEQKGLSIKGSDAAGNRYEAGSFRIASHLTTDESYNVYVLKNESLAGMIKVEDEIRSEAKEVIAYLKKSGIKTILLSGDREEICRTVAAETGIDEYYSQKLPEEKLSIVSELRSRSTVAMIGDGVNDAPALTAATIGISLSNATRVAIDSAQIILLQGNLLLLPEAFRISKHTLKTIRQNLFWAFFYNTLAIPIAAIGLLRPIVGALSMAFSDVIVIGNSLRLRTKKLS
jgi:Cu+-exporting ATPase